MHRAFDRLGVRIEQQLVRIAALAARRIPRAVHAEAVALPGLHAGHVAVPAERARLRQIERAARAVLVEQTQLDALPRLRRRPRSCSRAPSKWRPAEYQVPGQTLGLAGGSLSLAKLRYPTAERWSTGCGQQVGAPSIGAEGWQPDAARLLRCHEPLLRPFGEARFGGRASDSAVIQRGDRAGFSNTSGQACVRPPVATYRVQLSHAFTFRDLRGAVAVSPRPRRHRLLLLADPDGPRGSTHGYDICNHSELNPELGGARPVSKRCAASLKDRGLGLIVDFVPNHMGIDPQTNAWWRDVLENGPGSPYARFFDIDWLPVKAELRDKVLLPILGDQYGQVLERGELQLAFTDGALGRCTTSTASCRSTRGSRRWCSATASTRWREASRGRRASRLRRVCAKSWMRCRHAPHPTGVERQRRRRRERAGARHQRPRSSD